MGLFDKKYCDICGEKIGLLGNRKLEDGNLCKDCAKKLSPWFGDRRSSTVSEIREQLEWREKNRERAAGFCITRSFGERTKLFLDETHRWFAVTRATNPAADNADVLDFSAITGCRMNVDESRTELKYETKDSEGKTVRRSYSPPRYEYDYDFYITISVNVPYFQEMKFQLNDSSVHIPFRPSGNRWPGGSLLQNPQDEPLYDPYYRRYRESCEEICSLLDQIRSGSAASAVPGNLAHPAAEEVVSARRMEEPASWSCPSCGAENYGKFCESCGTKRP